MHEGKDSTIPLTVLFLVIFLLGLTIRGFFLTKFPESMVRPHDRWENNAIAHSLVDRGEFADPYMIPTGSTAHLPPVWPGIIALTWILFGKTMTGGYALLVFAAIVYSSLFALLPWLGEQFGTGRRAGLIGGLVGSGIVLGPGNGEVLAALVLGFLAIGFLHRWKTGSESVSVAFLLGLACGAAFHLQPALLPVVIGWMLFELGWSRTRRKWILVPVLVLGMITACLPWGLRNYRVFHDIFFIRSNVGLELRMGNHEDAAGAMDVMDARSEHRHPRTHLQEAHALRDLGEMEYMRRARIEAMQWIGSHPGEFLRLTLSRITQFWLGPFHQPGMLFMISLLTILAVVGTCRSLSLMTPPQRAALLIPLLTYPLIYYLVAYMPRYRVPLDWILLLLAGAAFRSTPCDPGDSREPE